MHATWRIVLPSYWRATVGGRRKIGDDTTLSPNVTEPVWTAMKTFAGDITRYTSVKSRDMAHCLIILHYVLS